METVVRLLYFCTSAHRGLPLSPPTHCEAYLRLNAESHLVSVSPRNSDFINLAESTTPCSGLFGKR